MLPIDQITSLARGYNNFKSVQQTTTLQNIEEKTDVYEKRNTQIHNNGWESQFFSLSSRSSRENFSEVLEEQYYQGHLCNLPLKSPPVWAFQVPLERFPRERGHSLDHKS